MSDTITQTRLSMRLDIYQSAYKEKNVRNDNVRKKAWDTTWKIADFARANSNLTPEIVDDVWMALNKL